MRESSSHLKMTLILLDLSKWQGHIIFAQLTKGEGIGKYICHSDVRLEMTGMHKGMPERLLSILCLNINLELEHCSVGSKYRDLYL